MMAKPYETVTILSCQFKHMCDEIDELREYKNKSKDTLDKIRAEIEQLRNFRAVYFGTPQNTDVLDKIATELKDLIKTVDDMGCSTKQFRVALGIVNQYRKGDKE